MYKNVVALSLADIDNVASMVVSYNAKYLEIQEELSRDGKDFQELIGLIKRLRDSFDYISSCVSKLENI